MDNLFEIVEEGWISEITHGHPTGLTPDNIITPGETKFE